MTDPRIYPELDDQLAAIDDPEAAESSGLFVIDSLDAANWAVRKLAVHTARFAKVEAFARRERERLDNYVEGERQRAERATGFLAGLLRRYHESRLAEDPTAKTIRLPAGDLTARKAPDVWDIDPDVFVAWAEANRREDLIRRPGVEVDRNAVKKLFTVTDRGVVDPATGEVVDGVTVTVGEDTYKVRPHVEAER